MFPLIVNVEDDAHFPSIEVLRFNLVADLKSTWTGWCCRPCTRLLVCEWRIRGSTTIDQVLVGLAQFVERDPADVAVGAFESNHAVGDVHEFCFDLMLAGDVGPDSRFLSAYHVTTSGKQSQHEK